MFPQLLLIPVHPVILSPAGHGGPRWMFACSDSGCSLQVCVLVWELRVLGWEVNYCAEFVPSAEDGYTVIVQKTRKLISTDEPVVKNSFKIGEPGKVVLTVNNTSTKKKKLLYRSKTKSSFESI